MHKDFTDMPNSETITTGIDAAIPSAQVDNSADAAIGDSKNNEVIDLAKMILNAASEKSSSEAQKKIIASAMAVHTKYAESLNVIEKLIADRQKVDARLKFLETQLNKKSKGKDKKEYWPPSKERISSGQADEKRAVIAGRPKSAGNRRKPKKTEPTSTQSDERQIGDAHESTAEPIADPTGGDESMPDQSVDELNVLPPQTNASANEATEAISGPKVSAKEPVISKRKKNKSNSSAADENDIATAPPSYDSSGAAESTPDVRVSQSQKYE
jgi:hypothetical protein